MAFRGILLALASYPEPTPASVVEDAVSVAAALGAHIAAISCEMRERARPRILRQDQSRLAGPEYHGLAVAARH